ncbi:hypothetical protein [Ancylobacter pratisalsi]|uniref:Uncharacterized protein n=1 Tax=Ancylobacter pratisalsi TaxID=1745854 RepID=A0A6P1YW53_9HYPH|nr:hypothetical protein [Ancylobacter pratisalsi]QIB35804.1 hypothetical protein G3A50_20380 [Ancylobacter pratisalsi]
MNWDRLRRPGRTYVEDSPYRPWSEMELLRSRVQRKPQTSTPVAATGPMTLARLVPHGINALSVWCPACRIAQHRDLGTVAPEAMQLPLDRLSEVVRCDRCGDPTKVSPFRSEDILPSA